MTVQHVKLPSPKEMLLHALPRVIEGVVLPTAAFYGFLELAGTRAAIFAALAAAYAALGRKLLRGGEMSGILLLGCLLLTFRAALGLATNSGFVYFLQPSVGTILLAVAFLASMTLQRPLAERLARDFCPLDPDLLARPYVRRFFVRISLLWTGVLMANAALSIWLLISSSLSSFVLLRSGESSALTVAGIAVSVWWFVRTLRSENVAVSWSGRR